MITHLASNFLFLVRNNDCITLKSQALGLIATAKDDMAMKMNQEHNRTKTIYSHNGDHTLVLIVRNGFFVVDLLNFLVLQQKLRMFSFFIVQKFEYGGLKNGVKLNS